VTVLDTRRETVSATQPPQGSAQEERRPPQAGVPSLSRRLAAHRIVVWSEPVAKETVLRTLASTFGKEEGIGDGDALYSAILKREEQGSTFFNEGVAFPHVRVPGLRAPAIALGLTREGVPDVITEKRMEIVFLILSPEEEPNTQVELLAQAGRAARNRSLLRNLASCATGEEVLAAIRDSETAQATSGF
jgi:mannitol/fructose-specific phosphotransferase system IIA component (Ntr-type)